jgi:peptidoglycan/LPS O-acetylase OafA/YrhL
MLSGLSGRFRRITTNQLYFPEIDGIRFVAISLVMLYHIYKYFISHTSVTTTFENGNYDLLNKFIDNSDRGVELFFVLSGFILCLPFAHHYIGNGKRIVLKHYYLRRVTRLEPPYFIALTGIFLLQVLFQTRPLAEMWPSWLASMGYAHMLIFHTIPIITIVTWSLEIEIQFYLLAPLFFKILSFDKATRRMSLIIAIIGIIFLQNFFPLPIISLFDYAQFFFIGILLADFYVTDDLASLFRKKWMVLGAVFSFIALIFLPIKSEIPDFYSLLWARLCFPFTIFIFYYAILKNSLLIKVFSYGFIPIIGGMCYSVYLLHYTIIGIAGRVTNSIHLTSHYLPNLILQIVLFTIPILIISALFYYFVERPFMSRKWMDMLLKKEKKPIPVSRAV